MRATSLEETSPTSSYYSLDREARAVRPLPTTTTSTWPGPLTETQLGALYPEHLETLVVLFEVSVRFLDDDRFAVDELLFTPGVGAIELPGKLAVRIAENQSSDGTP